MSESHFDALCRVAADPRRTVSQLRAAVELARDERCSEQARVKELESVQRSAFTMGEIAQIIALRDEAQERVKELEAQVAEARRLAVSWRNEALEFDDIDREASALPWESGTI